MNRRWRMKNWGNYRRKWRGDGKGSEELRRDCRRKRWKRWNRGCNREQEQRSKNTVARWWGVLRLSCCDFMDVILKIVKSIAILVTGLPPSTSWQDLIVWIGSLLLWPFDTYKKYCLEQINDIIHRNHCINWKLLNNICWFWFLIHEQLWCC